MNCKNCKKPVVETGMPYRELRWAHADDHLHTCFNEDLTVMVDSEGNDLHATPDIDRSALRTYVEQIPLLQVFTDITKLSLDEVIDAVGDEDKERVLMVTMAKRLERDREPDIFRDACEEMLGRKLPWPRKR